MRDNGIPGVATRGSRVVTPGQAPGTRAACCIRRAAGVRDAESDVLTFYRMLEHRLAALMVQHSTECWTVARRP